MAFRRVDVPNTPYTQVLMGLFGSAAKNRSHLLRLAGEESCSIILRFPSFFPSFRFSLYLIFAHPLPTAHRIYVFLAFFVLPWKAATLLFVDTSPGVVCLLLLAPGDPFLGRRLQVLFTKCQGLQAEHSILELSKLCSSFPQQTGKQNKTKMPQENKKTSDAILFPRESLEADTFRPNAV